MRKVVRSRRSPCVLECLESRTLFSVLGTFVAEGGTSGNSVVLVIPGPYPGTLDYPPPPGNPFNSFTPFAAGFNGGVHVGVGDIDGDGIPDIVMAPGSNGKPLVMVFNPVTGLPEREFFAYSQDFWGGVNVAVGDVNGDGKADIITAPAAGGVPLVNVFDGATGRLIRSFYAYETNFRGGVNVAAGDVDHDGKADIVTGAGYGGGPRVEVFSGANNHKLYDFYAFDPSFRGGVTVAAGDLDGDGHADLVVGTAFGAAGNVRAFSGATGVLQHERVTGYSVGVNVTTVDADGDGLMDVVATHNPMTSYDDGVIYKGTDFTYLPGFYFDLPLRGEYAPDTGGVYVAGWTDRV
ncbi:MAG TPA: VCBS repeat-containing protein [Phycisphaerae bacterium]|nr:VCBS repeat-containing protein [Phycisphaerae bacterium]